MSHPEGRKEDSTNRPLVWACKCDCGNKALVVAGNLSSGNTSSCGCLRSEMDAERKRKREHGWYGTKEYKTWKSIKQRVFNENSPKYDKYSQLGMSRSFANDFTKFLEDIGEIPEGMEGKASVDRIDNTKGYVEGNVRWATDTEQARNKGMYTNNKSGVTGVFNYQGKYWVAYWHDIDGKSKSRSFPIKNYGDELSFLMACEMRDVAIRRLNLAGAGYSENHGK